MTSTQDIRASFDFEIVAVFNATLGGFAAQLAYMFKNDGMVEIEYLRPLDAVVRFIPEKDVNEDRLDDIMNEAAELMDVMPDRFNVFADMIDTEGQTVIEYRFDNDYFYAGQEEEINYNTSNNT